MRTLLSFAALLLSILLVQLGVGVLAPLDALSGAQAGFSTQQIGFLGSAHFAGFFLGCIFAPPLMARVGHSRAFAVSAAIGIVSTLAHMLWVEPFAWMGMRVGAGFAVAAAYTVIESWLQAKLENENRGRVLSGYRMVDLTGSIGSQLLIIQLEPLTYAAYTLVGLVVAVSLLPLALTTAKPPPTPKRPKLRPWRAFVLSPLGAIGVLVTGLTNSSFRMVGPIYADRYELSQTQLAFFLAAGMIGGAAAQPVVGWLADKYDRRHVLTWISSAALVVCTLLSLGAITSGAWLIDLGLVQISPLVLAAFLFGLSSLPLYSVSAAHANDFCPPNEIVELNASLMFMFALGAIVSPALAAQLIELYGPNALWTYIGAAHVGLILFSVYRMTRRPSVAIGERTGYRYLPRTSFTLERLFGRKEPERRTDDDDQFKLGLEQSEPPKR